MEGENLKKQIKKRLREGETVEEILQTWTQCHYFMKSKYRFCNLHKAPNSNFCGIHRPVEENYTPRILKDALSSGITDMTTIHRIPCPIDPSHTIFNYNLHSHIKICNTGTRLAQLVQQEYYSKDCNSGTNLPTEETSEVVDVDALLQKIRDCYTRMVEVEIQEPLLNIPAYLNQEEVYNIVAGNAVAFERVRHAHQDVKIVCQMATESMFPTTVTSPHHVYVELGAGKGMLGLAVKSAAEQCYPGKSSLVMVERSGVHRKADKTLRENSDLAFTRIRMDIRDCFVAGLPGIVPTNSQESDASPAEPPPAVILAAKHLCGVATDITLRSLESLQRTPSSKDSFYGVSIATCCHHACNWKDYVNPEWIRSCGVSSQEFEVLTHWSGWAHTVGSGVRLPKAEVPSTPHSDADVSPTIDEAAEDLEHSLPSSTAVPTSHRPQGLSYEEMSEIGKMVKRILDHGRVLYLRSMGFTVSQRRYCDPDLSPECYLIVGTKGTKL